MQIDHVLYAVTDLDAAAARLHAELGLASVEGGRHPDLGTANRIVPVGPHSFIELIAVVDPETAAASATAATVGMASQLGDFLLGWMVGTDDIDAECRRLGMEAASFRRDRPDGTTVTWRLAGMQAIAAEPSLPVFIQWDDPALHPAGEEAPHEVSPTGFAWIETGGDQERMNQWIGSTEIPVRATGGFPGLHAFAVRTADGSEITISNPDALLQMGR